MNTLGGNAGGGVLRPGGMIGASKREEGQNVTLEQRAECAGTAEPVGCRQWAELCRRATFGWVFDPSGIAIGPISPRIPEPTTFLAHAINRVANTLAFTLCPPIHVRQWSLLPWLTIGLLLLVLIFLPARGWLRLISDSTLGPEVWTMASPDVSRRDAVVMPRAAEPNVSGPDHEDVLEEQYTPSFPSSLLENLPAELRDHILLQMPDLPTLRALVRASPTMHAGYLENRNSILRACLAREFDGYFADAYACVNSRMRKESPTRTDARITRFLGGYRLWRSGPNPPRPDRDLRDPDSCRWLAAFHLSVVRPLTNQYVAWALGNLTRASTELAGMQKAVDTETGTEAGRGGQSLLRRSEEIRISRAFYQYETFHHLFGRNDVRRRGGFRDNELNQLFMCVFDPWEAEALGCIDVFIRDRYRAIFAEVKWDLDDSNPKFWEGGFNPSGSFNLNVLHDSKYRVYGYATRLL